MFTIVKFTRPLLTHGPTRVFRVPQKFTDLLIFGWIDFNLISSLNSRESTIKSHLVNVFWSPSLRRPNVAFDHRHQSITPTARQRIEKGRDGTRYLSTENLPGPPINKHWSSGQPPGLSLPAFWDSLRLDGGVALPPAACVPPAPQLPPPSEL